MTVDATTEGTGTEDALGIDAARSACVLIGVDHYSELEPLRSVRHNLTELAAALTDEAILGIPAERITTVRNPESAAALVGPIRTAARVAADTLIVYYAGHGLLDRAEEELYLTLPTPSRTSPRRPSTTPTSAAPCAITAPPSAGSSCWTAATAAGSSRAACPSRTVACGHRGRR